jgi:hypothetical protein
MTFLFNIATMVYMDKWFVSLTNPRQLLYIYMCVCLLLSLSDRIDKRFLLLENWLQFKMKTKEKEKRHVNAYKEKTRKRKGVIQME